MHTVESNFHAFTHLIGEEKIGYLAIWSCALALQRRLHRYYASSSFSYNEIIEHGKNSKDFDLAEFSESYLCPLIRTENFELIVDGCQYSRAEKTARISSWNIAKEHLNVCVHPLEKGKNCSHCNKCMRTMITLEALGKLNEFEGVFDLSTYRKDNFLWKCKYYRKTNRNYLEPAVIEFAKGKNMRLPSPFVSEVVYFLYSKWHGLRRRLHIKMKETYIFD